MEPTPSTGRAACARFAAVRRWHPDDESALAKARRDLVIAHAAALTQPATALFTEASL